MELWLYGSMQKRFILLNWITEWMIKRQQSVELNNKVLDFPPVTSGNHRAQFWVH